jgi:hypothetical protein
VVVVPHEAEGVAKPLVPFAAVREHLKEELVVAVVAVNEFTRVAASKQVVNGAREADSKRSRDPSTLRHERDQLRTAFKAATLS